MPLANSRWHHLLCRIALDCPYKVGIFISQNQRYTWVRLKDFHTLVDGFQCPAPKTTKMAFPAGCLNRRVLSPCGFNFFDKMLPTFLISPCGHRSLHLPTESHPRRRATERCCERCCVNSKQAQRPKQPNIVSDQCTFKSEALSLSKFLTF